MNTYLIVAMVESEYDDLSVEDVYNVYPHTFDILTAEVFKVDEGEKADVGNEDSQE